MQLHFHLSTQNICQKSAPFSFWIYTIEFPLEPSFALSRVLREGEPLKYSGNKEEAPCNLAAENRENRKVKMKLQVVKESEVATFSTIYMSIYIYMRCYALS